MAIDILAKAFGEGAPIMYALIGAFLLVLISSMKKSKEYENSPRVRDWFLYVTVVAQIVGSAFILSSAAWVFWGKLGMWCTLGGAVVALLVITVPSICLYKKDKVESKLATVKDEPKVAAVEGQG